MLGRLLIDVDENGLKEVVDYELVPVKDISEDEQVLNYVLEARQDLDDQYGKDYLNKALGFSKLKPGSEGQKIWNYFITDALMESTGSDISVHTPSMSGSNHPVGKITRYDLYNSHPRWFDFNDEKGWYVYRAKVKGFWIRPIFRIVMNFGLPLSFTGISFKWKKNIFGKWVVRKMRIKGKKIKPFKYYEIALPEGIARGGPAISPLVNLLLRKINKTPYTVVRALELKLESSKNQVLGPNSLNPEYDRVYFPGEPR